MSDPVTALSNAVAEGPVRVAETGPHGMITLRGDLSSDAVAAAVQSATGVAVPEVRRLSSAGDRSILWMSPDEAMILVPRAEVAQIVTALTQTLGTAHALVADMSDARARFRLTGEDAHLREVMARLAPVDMDRFEPGEIRRTRLAQIPVALWMPEPGAIELICFRSVAQYAFDVLTVAASGPRI